MSKGMLLYTARLVGERAIALGLFLLASHGVMGTRALVWFVTYFASVASAVWLYRTSADTLEHRANIAATKDSTPTWDKVILALFWLLAYFVVYWVAGATADHVASDWRAVCRRYRVLRALHCAGASCPGSSECGEEDG